MPDQPKPTPDLAGISRQLVDESNRLSTTEGAGLTQGLCLIAAGLFSVAAAIQATKVQPKAVHKRKNRRRQTQAKPGWKNVPPRAKP